MVMLEQLVLVMLEMELLLVGLHLILGLVNMVPLVTKAIPVDEVGVEVAGQWEVVHQIHGLVNAVAMVTQVQLVVPAVVELVV